MFKSQFVKDTDIICEKPKQFKKVFQESENIYIYLYNELFKIPTENINEYFLNKKETLINCKLLKDETNTKIYDYYVDEYFYKNGSGFIEFSAYFREITGKLEYSMKSDLFEFIFNDNGELILNILIDNNDLK